MTPYYFKERGQGLFFIPEVGAICIVVNAQGQYFVMGFLPPIDATYSAQVSPPKQNLSQPADGQTSEQQTSDPAHVSYRSNREGDMVAGDGCLKTRAGNKLKIFTNGNILVSATYLCLRLYSKLENWIHDICVNYMMRTPGGEIQWKNQTGQCEYSRKFKMATTDPMETVKEEIGPSIGVSRRTVQSTVGIVQYKEQINPDGSFTVESMTPMMGGHKITFDATQIKVETTLAGINSITMNASGISIDSSATINVNAFASANVTALGSASITSTGPMSLTSSSALTMTAPVSSMSCLNPAGVNLTTIAGSTNKVVANMPSAPCTDTYTGPYSISGLMGVRIDGFQLPPTPYGVPMLGQMIYSGGYVKVWNGGTWRKLDWHD